MAKYRQGRSLAQGTKNSRPSVISGFGQASKQSGSDTGYSCFAVEQLMIQSSFHGHDESHGFVPHSSDRRCLLSHVVGALARESPSVTSQNTKATRCHLPPLRPKNLKGDAADGAEEVRGGGTAFQRPFRHAISISNGSKNDSRGEEVASQSDRAAQA